MLTHLNPIHLANFLVSWKRKQPIWVVGLYNALSHFSTVLFVPSAASPPASAVPSTPCFSCCSGQAKPQLPHMPCLLDVWTKLGGSEVKTDLLSEWNPVRRDGWKCLPLWFLREQRRKTNGVWLPYFLKVLEVTWPAAEHGLELMFAAWLLSCPAVCQLDTMEKAPQHSSSFLVPIQSRPPTTAQPVQWHRWQLSRPAHSTMTLWVIGR